MPKATAVFDADDSRLSGALARINGMMLALQSRIAKFAAAFIAVRSAARVVTAGALSDLSANTGIAVGDLVVLQQEFANAGKSAEDIGPVFGKMAKTLQGGSADDTIKKLGVDLEELKKKAPAEQFRTLGAAINSVQDPSQKAAASMQVFGRSGAELLALFSSDGFGDAASQVGSQAETCSHPPSIRPALRVSQALHRDGLGRDVAGHASVHGLNRRLGLGNAWTHPSTISTR